MTGSISNNLFTAPVTGFYQFTCTIDFSGVTTAMNLLTVEILLGTDVRTIFKGFANQDSGGFVTVSGIFLSGLTALDTVRLQTVISGGIGDTASIVGGQFTGRLLTTI